MKTPEIGDTLTYKSDFFGASGLIFNHKGDKVIVREVVKTPGRWGYFNWIDESIDGVKLEGENGITFLSAFVETSE